MNGPSLLDEKVMLPSTSQRTWTFSKSLEVCQLRICHIEHGAETYNAQQQIVERSEATKMCCFLHNFGIRGIFSIDGVLMPFKGVWLCMKHEITAMIKCGGGAMMNTASIDALLYSPRTNIYAASKSAVIALSKVAAKEYARDGIRRYSHQRIVSRRHSHADAGKSRTIATRSGTVDGSLCGSNSSGANRNIGCDQGHREM
jgi:hypothetical protein